MIITRAKLGELIKGVGLEIIDAFDQGTELYTPGVSTLLMMETSDVAQKNFTSVVAENTVKQKAEGEESKELNQYRGYVTSVDFTAYSSKVTVSHENIMDRDFSAQLDEATALGRAINFSQDEAGFQLFNGGWDTRQETIKGYRYQYYNDGVPTFSVQHPTPVPGQSAQSNASATNIAFSEANLETARLALKKQLTDAGGPLIGGGREMLVVPNALEKTAMVVTESELIPGSTNNDINVYKGSVGFTTSILFDAINGGSDTAWYLVYPGMTKFVHDVREGVQPWTEVDEDKKTLTVGVYARWGNYTKDWKRSWGSKGTGSGTYTA